MAESSINIVYGTKSIQSQATQSYMMAINLVTCTYFEPSLITTMSVLTLYKIIL